MVDAGDAEYQDISVINQPMVSNKVTRGETKKKKQRIEENPVERTIALDTKIIAQEAIINGNEPKWLIIKKQRKTDSNIKDIIEGNTLIEEEIIFETQEQNQWQCNKCKAITKSKEKLFYCESCNRDSTFKQITKPINTKRWKLTHWKDVDINGTEMGMTVIYTTLVKLIKRCIVFEHDLLYEIFALWIIASYKMEDFDSISFLLFQGLIESGKTRGLDLLRELGFRMIHTTGVTFPAMCRYTDNYQAGILIDEIDSKIDQRTEAGREYLSFLKPSYRRGSVYSTAHREDQDETKEYANYGFKAFAGEHGGTDQALRSRCIVFRMEQAFPDIPELRYIQEELDQMQNLLLNYRFKYGAPQPLPIDFDLKGRDRELFSCLIQTAQHIGLDAQHIIDFIKRRTTEKIEALQETDEYLILKAIYSLSTRPKVNQSLLPDDAPEFIKYSSIASECGWDDDSDVSKKKRQRIGIILKKMQLKPKRMNDGTVLPTNNEYNISRLDNLYRRFYVV